MHDDQTSLLRRDDTFLGVCEGLGQDFGFNPLWLRLALALALFFNPVAVLVGYTVLGVVVAVARWTYRPRTRAETAQPVALASTRPTAVRDVVEEDRRELPLAA